MCHFYYILRVQIAHIEDYCDCRISIITIATTAHKLDSLVVGRVSMLNNHDFYDGAHNLLEN